MKKSLLLSSALVFGSMSLSWAGGMVEPAMTTEEIAEKSASSGGGMLLPLLLLLAIAALASGNSEGSASPSDIRLKEDVTAIGMTPQGLPLYRFRYRGLPEIWEGVMAQDVARLFPAAIIKKPFGFMAVNYAKLGLTMRRAA